MKNQQMLIFEISKGCNLARQHAHKCPVADPRRWENQKKVLPITDRIITRGARMAYREMGFRGHIAWHYYNEPTMEWTRMLSLMDQISMDSPMAKFCLFTNGELIVPEDIDQLKRIDNIWVSNYYDQDFTWLSSQHPGAMIMPSASLDNRLAMVPTDAARPCLRPFTEVVIDYWGNFHLCCMDWRNEASLPNIWDVGFKEGVERFIALRNLLTRVPYGDGIPARCHTCSGAITSPCPVFVSVQQKAIEWVKKGGAVCDCSQSE